MISIEIREPIRMNALNRKKSPSVNPITPDADNQNNWWTEASSGRGRPRTTER